MMYPFLQSIRIIYVMWVTAFLYRNKRLLMNIFGAHPVYLGPTSLHFTKYTQTFTRFALEIQACNPETREIKKIGVDKEDAISIGVKSSFPRGKTTAVFNT